MLTEVDWDSSSCSPLGALPNRDVVLRPAVMRSLYRGPFVHLDSLWRLSYLANAVIHVCFSKVSRPRDSDHSTFDKQAQACARCLVDASRLIPRNFSN